MRPSNDGGSVCSQQPHMIDKRKVWCTAHVKSVAWHDDTRKITSSYFSSIPLNYGCASV